MYVEVNGILSICNLHMLQIQIPTIGKYCIAVNWFLCLLPGFNPTVPPDQPNDALATALSEVTAGGGLVGQDGAGSAQVKDPLSALAAAAELDQVRSDVAAVSVSKILRYHLVF